MKPLNCHCQCGEFYWNFLSDILKKNQKSPMAFPITFRYPFDWKNPIGYCIAAMIQFSIASYVLPYLSCIVCYGFGNFMYSQSLAYDMRCALHSIGTEIKKSKRIIIDCIYVHSTGRELSGFETQIRKQFINNLFFLLHFSG